MPDFLTTEDVLLLHRDQVDRYGGQHGVRDLGLLDSAIAMPRASFGGDQLHKAPFEMSAAYLFHVVGMLAKQKPSSSSLSGRIRLSCPATSSAYVHPVHAKPQKPRWRFASNLCIIHL